MTDVIQIGYHLVTFGVCEGASHCTLRRLMLLMADWG